MVEGFQLDRKEQVWHVYMIRCKNGSLYTGITTDVVRRFSEHQAQGKKCAKYLRGRGQLKLVYCEAFSNRKLALQAEFRFKGLSKVQKEELVRAQRDMEPLGP